VASAFRRKIPADSRQPDTGDRKPSISARSAEHGFVLAATQAGCLAAMSATNATTVITDTNVATSFGATP
jgi:hypothetical protein